MWQGAIAAFGASLLIAGCASKDPGFEGDMEKAIRLMDEGKNAEAYAVLDPQCGASGAMPVTDPDYGLCRDLLGDAKAGEAGINWFDFIGALPDDDSTTEFEITNVVADMVGAAPPSSDPTSTKLYADPTDLAAKTLSLEEALKIHGNVDPNNDGDWSDCDISALNALTDAEKAQLAMEASLYILYTVSGNIPTADGAPMSLDALKDGAGSVNLSATQQTNLSVAIQLVQLGSAALGADNDASTEFDTFVQEIGGSAISSATINNYLSML